MPRRTKASRNGSAPRAMITTKATLVGVGTAAGASSGYGSDKLRNNVMRLTLDISIGAPRKIPTWDEYKQGKRWEIERAIDRAVIDATPKKVKAKKPKKGEKAEKAEPAEKVDAKAIRARVTAEKTAEIRAEYDRHVTSIAQANNRMAHRAAAWGMFMALRGSDLQLTLAPLQGGMVELFEGDEQKALPAGAE